MILDKKLLERIRSNAAASDFDWRTFRKPGDTYDAPLEYYRQKRAVCDVIAARRVLEIGVRAGYSAAAFLSCPRVWCYVGIDNDSDQDGGRPGYCRWAEGMLVEKFGVSMHLFVGSSHNDQIQFDVGNLAPFDLVHVDGDHSIDGCTRDLEFGLSVLAPGGLVLADDYTFSPRVHAAIDAFVKRTARLRFLWLPSYRGEALIQPEA